MLGIEWAWLIPFYGFVAFGIIALFGRYLPGRGIFLSILAILAGFVTFWPVLLDLLDRGLPDGVGEYHFYRDWFTAGDITVRLGIIVDPLTVIMLGLVTFVALGVQVYSLGYMRGDPHIDWYFAVHSLFAAAMLTLVLADNLLLVYFAWELVGLCSYLLIGFWWERRSAAEAAKKAFITTRIGDVGLLIGILLLVVETGTFDIGDILAQVKSGELSGSVVWGSAVLIFLGAMGKSAQFPLHVWLPDAMEGPSPVSALIHAATMVVAGVFLVARLFPLFEAVPNVQLLVASVGITTALVGASMALVVTDLKRILAYSTISHIGFMMLALGVGGYTAALFHLVAHGVAKAMLFLTAGSIMHAMNDETDIRKMGGLRQRMPITSIAFILGALALAGIPPLSGFWSKDEILLAVQRDGGPILLVLFLAAAVLSALYMARTVRIVFFGPLKPETEHAHEGPLSMRAPLVVFGLVTVAMGFIALPLGNFLFFEHVHEFEISALWSPVGIVLALGGFYAAWRLFSGPPERVERLRERFAPLHRLLVNKYYLDDIYQWVVDNVALRAARIVAVFDRVVVNDGGVNGTGETVVNAGRRLRALATGKLYNYGMVMGLGIVFIAVILWASRVNAV
jgi:NADH-quinone oxidoreductase subunit L